MTTQNGACNSWMAMFQVLTTGVCRACLLCVLWISKPQPPLIGTNFYMKKRQ